LARPPAPDATAAHPGTSPLPTPDQRIPRPRAFRSAGPLPPNVPRAFRSAGPVASNAPRAPTVHMLHPGGPHPFGRLPVAMAAQGGWTPVTLAGHIPPMVYMEVRSNNQPDEQQSGQSPTAMGEFDDFLPCHSRHLSRSTRADTPRSQAASATTAAFSVDPTGPARPGAPAGAVPASVDEFMNEIFRQVRNYWPFLPVRHLNFLKMFLGDGQWWCRSRWRRSRIGIDWRRWRRWKSGVDERHV
jgi:hypothetical protein